MHHLLVGVGVRGDVVVALPAGQRHLRVAVAVEVRQLRVAVVAMAHGVVARLRVVGLVHGGVAVVHRAARVVAHQDAEVTAVAAALPLMDVAVLDPAAVDRYKAALVVGVALRVELGVREAVQQVALLELSDEAAHEVARHRRDGDGRMHRRRGRPRVAHPADEAAHHRRGVLRVDDRRHLRVLNPGAAVHIAYQTAHCKRLVALLKVEVRTLDEQVLHHRAVRQLAEEAVVRVLAVEQAHDAAHRVAVAVEHAAVAFLCPADRHPAVVRHVDVGHQTGRVAGVGRLAVQAVHP